MESLDKKYIQKVRMVKYFVDATIEIIEKEGYEAVTIRKVADIAGYNSATLYNYFDNLEHLLFFASMRYLQDYICLLYTSPSPRDRQKTRMPSSA